jgi:hypothetical protein
MANPPEVRKYLRTYGLTPPATETFEVQAQRCLRLLAMKTTNIEKFQYLVHLRATNVHLFYRLLSENIKVRLDSLSPPITGARKLTAATGTNSADIHPNCRRGLPTMARDLHAARGHVYFLFGPWQYQTDSRQLAA